MKLKVTVFAQLKDYFEPEQELELADTATIADAMQALADKNPEAKAVLAASRVAIDEEMAEPATRLHEGQRLFFLPPSSGG